MRAFFAEKDAVKRAEIAARQLHALTIGASFEFST
jgi:hypothetical protein